MARKKKQPDTGPSNAYLLSFGDTMTTLLAFFIVLNSLAEEQTGANLHRGTGSFIRHMNTAGLPGKFAGDQSMNAIPRQETSPLYIVPEEGETSADKDPTGPDDEDNQVRVIDREQDQFDKFMHQVDRVFPVDEQPRTRGEVAFDLFERLEDSPPYLPSSGVRVLAEALPLLRQGDYRAEVIVWATTPAPSAWKRATRQAEKIVKHLVEVTRLDQRQAQRLTGYGRVWIDRKAKRPVLSIVVRRVAPER